MLKRSILARTAVSTGAVAMSLAALLAAPSMASAQQSVDVPVPSRSDAPPPSQYDNRAYDQSQGSSAQSDRDYQRQRAEYDRRYAEWARENCHAQNGGSTAFGAIAGGILGAVVGSQLSGRGDRTTGSLIGGGLGAVAGGAIGSSAGSDKCNQARQYAPREAYGYGQSAPPPPPQGGYAPQGGYYGQPQGAYGPPPAAYGPPPGGYYYEDPGPYYYGYGGPVAYGPPVVYGPPVGVGIVIGGGRRWGHRW